MLDHFEFKSEAHRGLVFGVAWIQICMAEEEEQEKLEEDGFLRHEI